MGNGNRRHPLVTQLSSKQVFREQHDNDVEEKVDTIVGSKAYEECMNLFVQSKLAKRKDILQVSWDDINTDPKLLGKGSYCHVFKAYINMSVGNGCYIQGCEANCQFAVKCLKPQRNNLKDYQSMSICLCCVACQNIVLGVGANTFDIPSRPNLPNVVLLLLTSSSWVGKSLVTLQTK
jgi:hypothetical protein